MRNFALCLGFFIYYAKNNKNSFLVSFSFSSSSHTVSSWTWNQILRLVSFISDPVILSHSLFLSIRFWDSSLFLIYHFTHFSIFLQICFDSPISADSALISSILLIFTKVLGHFFMFYSVNQQFLILGLSFKARVFLSGFCFLLWKNKLGSSIYLILDFGVVLLITCFFDNFKVGY